MIILCLFDVSEQKKQKVSEIKAGLDDAEALVLFKSLFLVEVFSFLSVLLYCDLLHCDLCLDSSDSENGP